MEIRVITSAKNSDYVPNLSSLARQQYDLIVANGFLMAEATETVAKSFPNTKFAIIDFPATAMESKPKNVQGLLFKESEAGYLVGYMAGLYVKDKGGDQTVSAVGGQKVPAVDAFIAGYQKGAAEANPDVKVLFGYSEEFVAQDKCKELALNQIGEGSQVVFAVAGQCGLGALDAAKQEGVQGIGVDADQGYLGDHIMTSAVKKVDEAVFTAVQQVQDDAFKGGQDTIFDVKSGGVAVGKIERGRREVQEAGGRAAGEDRVRRADRPADGAEVALADTAAPLALELRGITKRFGALVANDGVDLDVRRGEVHALLGENGAGKSTLMNVVYGLHQPDEGEILLRGEPVQIASPRQAIGLRIGMVHQHFMLIPVMTRGRERRARLRAAQGRAARRRGPPSGACGSWRTASGWPSTRAPAWRTSASASSSAWRSCACCTAAPTCSSSTSRPPCSPPRRRPSCSRCCARSPRRACRSSSSPTSCARCSRSPTASPCCGAARRSARWRRRARRRRAWPS